MVDEDWDVAVLEPGRETLRSKRRRAAYADVMDELDGMVSDFDYEWNNNRIDCLCGLIIIIEIQPCRQYKSHFLVR